MSTRDGRSLVSTVNTVPTSTMLTLGFIPSQAARIIRVRRVLPLVDDRRAPCLDARKLWERIGKPHGRFDKWADRLIRPLMDQPDLSAQIWAVKVAARGTPRIDYKLSRNVAAHLAMMVTTPEGADIRDYFLDMEDLAQRLTEHLGVRVTAIVETDREVTHMMRRRAGDDAKARRIPKAAVLSAATEREKRLKDTVCLVLTGYRTRWWRETFGRRVRDVLDTSDAALYAKCYESALAAIGSGVVKNPDALVRFLTPTYGGKVRPQKYRVREAT
ncbi:Phage anti-repressor protein [Variovorax sp. PBS-H4]|uniref:antA/AntB antirepressor family protein n=1 Tax=Variovorax sp. PBS-H4 TaxID=434008 RepID=UPI001316BEF0|nr:antA/AntB antirepressor family protein [Variovorax sp. PBS-H4]VTU35786.1 Phage anti-repressor protein [Variovorax sp. PBS-H4]